MSPEQPHQDKGQDSRAHQDYEHCLSLFADGHNQIVYRTLVADTQTAVGAMMKLSADSTFHFLLESVEGGEVRGRFSAIGLFPDLVWRARGKKAEINRQIDTDPDRFEAEDMAVLDSLRALMAESEMPSTAPLPPMAAGLFGYLGYDMIRHIETLPDNNPDRLDVYDAVLMRPSIMVIFDRLKDTMTLACQIRPQDHETADDAWQKAQALFDRTEAQLSQALPPAAISDTALAETLPQANMSQDNFFDMVGNAKEYIKAGDIFQVVLSQRFSIPFDLPAMSLYRSLRRLNPSPFLFCFQLDELAIVGSSPEILVRLRDDEVTIRPIAGTRPRGRNEAEDAENARDLLSDVKERSEHLMLLDLGRNDVGRVSQAGSVEVHSHFEIEHYSHVMHIASEVRGQRRDECDMIDAMVAGFPAGTVSGAPKIRAMEIIDELEPDRRGVYAGAIGYLGVSGDMDTCIALRTAVIKDGQMHIQAGAGIVYDSVAQSEFEECQNKARALLRAAADALNTHS